MQLICNCLQTSRNCWKNHTSAFNLICFWISTGCRRLSLTFWLLKTREQFCSLSFECFIWLVPVFHYRMCVFCPQTLLKCLFELCGKFFAHLKTMTASTVVCCKFCKITAVVTLFLHIDRLGPKLVVCCATIRKSCLLWWCKCLYRQCNVNQTHCANTPMFQIFATVCIFLRHKNGFPHKKTRKSGLAEWCCQSIRVSEILL